MRKLAAIMCSTWIRQLNGFMPMTALHTAVFELLEAQKRFFDAFEDAVADALKEPDRIALQGENGGEGQDRLPLLLLLCGQARLLRDCLLNAEEDEAPLLAEASVKNTASVISAKASQKSLGALEKGQQELAT